MHMWIDGLSMGWTDGWAWGVWMQNKWMDGWIAGYGWMQKEYRMQKKYRMNAGWGRWLQNR